MFWVNSFCEAEHCALFTSATRSKQSPHSDNHQEEKSKHICPLNFGIKVTKENITQSSTRWKNNAFIPIEKETEQDQL